MGFLDLFAMHDPSDYAGFYADLDWRTYNIDLSIYGKHGACCRPEQRALTYMLQQARKDVMQLEWQLARSGSDCYMYSGQQMTQIQQDMLSLQKEKARLEAENEVLKEQLSYFRGHASNRAYKAAADRMRANEPTSNQYEVIEVLNPVKEEPAKNPQPKKGTRFTSKTGASKQENMMAAAAYWENEYSVDEIAGLLELSPASVRAYLSTIKRHYEVKLTQHGRMICFDKDFGGVTWSLAFYERTNINRAVNGD